MSTYKPDRYPAAPLQELLRRKVESTYRILPSSKSEHTVGMATDRICQGGAVVDELLNIPAGSTKALLARDTDLGLNWVQADEWAIRLGYHPAAIWPEWFSDEKCAAALRRETGGPSPAMREGLASGVPQGNCTKCGAVRRSWSRRDRRWQCVACATRRKAALRERMAVA